MAKRILVVDDDNDILDLLEYNLEKEGYRVKTICDSAQAMEVAQRYRPDLIVLDIMMPAPNGIELCKLLREKQFSSEMYIFFLTARSETYFQEAAFDTGADDYIEKIVGMRSLTYKIHSVLSRDFVIRKCVAEVQLGSLRVNRRKGIVKIGAREIMLSKPETELMFFLAQNPGKPISTESLLNNIWGSDLLSVSHPVENYIRNLSHKLGHKWILPVGGERYRLQVD